MRTSDTVFEFFQKFTKHMLFCFDSQSIVKCNNKYVAFVYGLETGSKTDNLLVNQSI